MSVVLRAGRPEDAEACGRICYSAFAHISARHGFPPDFPAPEAAIGLLSMLLSHPGFFSVVAEREGRIIGSNFLDERSPIAGVGPITIDPEAQDTGTGRRLMEAVLERASERSFAGVRLLQAAYHNRSLSLYAKLGFEIREPLAVMQGPPPGREIPGYAVRAATEADLEACNELCYRVHGHHRAGEVRDALAHAGVSVVEHGGRITGYSTGVAFFGHTVGETSAEVKALIGAAGEFGGPGFLLPMRNGELLRWCLGSGLRVVHLMTLMSRGLYNEPQGGFLPSILY